MKPVQERDAVQVGQALIAYGRPYPGLTEGKEYTVVRYEPRHGTPTFMWPPYITVIGDHGKPVTAHCHRFRLPEEKHEP
jgi:hypothetical protein